jgi:uncharacterized protein (DUF2141 family)
VLLILALAACAATAAAPAPGPEPRRVVVTVRGFRNRAGALRVKLVADGEGFPGSDTHSAAKRRVPIGSTEVRVTFDGVAPGGYAVVALHDEDDDGTLDRSRLGLPTEGVGFSSGARMRFGPPTFEEARFELGARDAELAVDLQYLPF